MLSVAISAIVILAAMPSWAQDTHIVFTPQWTAQAQFAGYYVAKEKGFYDEVNLDVQIVHPSITEPALSRMYDRESHITTMQLCQAMKIIDDGFPLVNILQTSMNNSTIIISRYNKNPMTLKGARVAKWKGFGYLSECVNIKEGLDYNWIFLNTPVSLFIKGAFDAMVATTYSEYIKLLQAGMTIPEESAFRFSEHGYNVQDDGVYMSREYYEKHREQARKFAEASRRGWEYTASHPDEALDYVMKYVHEEHVATNRTVQKLMLQEVLRLQVDKQSGKREFRLRPDMVELGSRLMKECHLLKNEIKYSQIICK